MGVPRIKRVRSLLASLRLRETLLLQGPPFIGIAFSAGRLTVRQIPSLALFGAASSLLVAHMWSVNDWADFEDKRQAVGPPGRNRAGTGVDRPTLLRFSLALLALSLGLFALLPPQTLLLAVSIAVFGFLYSSTLVHAKGVAVMSTLLHLGGGLLHFLLGYSLFRPVDRHAGLIAPLFGLIFAAGHATQEAQDFATDRALGVRTNAVVFGQRPVFLAALAGFTVAYAYLMFLAGTGVVPARLGWLALVLCPLHLYWAASALRRGLSSQGISQLRDRYRLLFGLLGLAIISTLFF